MKKLHRDDLYGWSVFDPERNIDFHSVVWVQETGNVVIDPLPLSEHDRRHLQDLGGVGSIIITNSDHSREGLRLKREWNALLYGPAAEKDHFPFVCDKWLREGDSVIPGLAIFELAGSKTPGELALMLGGHTLVTGDLIRCHMAAELCMLPDPKLADKQQAVASVRRLADIAAGVETVLVGDGWPVFRDGGAALRKLAMSL